ncbi:hypothetical protein QCA50_009812 [Cerrena zonata]|uniref:Aminoglycoside phosphotransferase domain-containing protein n=1 Tax=Cerrena zonata TaxID=2478898 RepID=A0AAW0G4I6_9APHY
MPVLTTPSKSFPVMTPRMLPTGDNIEFRESAFFSRHSALPSPAEVRALTAQAGGPYKRLTYSRRRNILMFLDTGLLVKWGSGVAKAEGQCLWACRHSIPGVVPVPEIYGWRIDRDHELEDTFLYMELVKGDTLEARWPTLLSEDKFAISMQLRDILARMRRVRQDPDDPFLGHVGRQPLLDYIFTETALTGGPFQSTHELNDFLARMCLMKRKGYDPKAPISHPEYRSQLPDDGPITFTHSDLHPSNIMVSGPDDGPPRILAIIDWQQSGWYPSYWEWCKLAWCVPYEGEWYTEYLPQILTPEDAYEPWCYFTLSLGF